MKKLKHLYLSLGLATALGSGVSATTFSDVSASDWYYTYVNTMAEKEYVSGYADGTFLPLKTLSIAEFSTMMANGFYGETLVDIKDVNTPQWWESYLDTCLLRGGLKDSAVETYYFNNNKSWGTFPTGEINRYEMALMIYNLLIERGVPQISYSDMESTLTRITDDIPYSYMYPVSTAFHYGFLAGRDDGSFDGYATLTRAEATAVLNALVQSPLIAPEVWAEIVNGTHEKDEPEVEEPEVEEPEVEKPEVEEPEVEKPEEEEPEIEEPEEEKPEVEEPEVEEPEEEKPEEEVPEEEEPEEDEPEVEEPEEDEPEVEEPEEEEEPEIDQNLEDGDYEGEVEELPSDLPSQEELGTWITSTIVGNSTNYVSGSGLYVKDASDYKLTASDLSARTDVVLEPGLDAPQILIYHTHGTESYTQTPTAQYTPTSTYRTDDNDHNVIAVGAAMKAVFEEAGFQVIHDTNWHDHPGMYSTSYSNSGATVTKYYEEYPSLLFAIDVHRDGLESNGVPLQLVSQQGDETIAQVMLHISSETAGYSHPNWRDNFSLALSIQEGLMEYGDFARPVNLVKGHYNQQRHPGAVLLEVGNHGNTLEQAVAAGELFAYSAALTLGGNFDGDTSTNSSDSSTSTGSGSNFPVFGVDDDDIDWNDVPAFG